MDDQLKAEFEKRYADDTNKEKEINKEREYLKYKISKDYKLNEGIWEEWKKTFPLGVDFTFLKDKPYVWRILSLAEYTGVVTTVQKLGGDSDDLQVKIAEAALLYPAINNFKTSAAGLASTLANAILESSGFARNNVMAFPV